MSQSYDKYGTVCGFEERAQAHFERVASSSASSLSGAALWRLGWTAYRSERFEPAVELFDRLIDAQVDEMGALRGRYWRARALGRMGDERAGPEFAAMAREFPFSYYGWRAGARTVGDAARVSPGPVAAGTRALEPHDLQRPRILMEAGLLEAARLELQRVQRRARGLQDRIDVAQLLADAGDFNEAQRLMVYAYEEALARGPVARYEEVWWHAWPAAYTEQVKRATAGEGSVEPSLVLSIMREESGYREQVISPVGARGLMQIMVPTGERLAKQVGLPSFSPDDLFDPMINIQLGSHYLSTLSRRFDGRLSAAIASYNAGPDTVSGWGASTPDVDDEWVEAIPYDQTRSYVKRVLRSVRAYQVLY